MILRNKQRGIGLLELMLSLAIIAAIILMATRYFTQASEASKVTQTTEMIGTLINASFKWVKGQPNFSDISIKELVDKKILPPNWWDDKNDKNKNDPWGQPIDLQASPPGVENSNQIQINIYGASKSACESINDIMAKQGVADYGNSCSDTSGYQAVYPADDPYQPS